MRAQSAACLAQVYHIRTWKEHAEHAEQRRRGRDRYLSLRREGRLQTAAAATAAVSATAPAAASPGEQQQQQQQQETRQGEAGLQAGSGSKDSDPSSASGNSEGAQQSGPPRSQRPARLTRIRSLQVGCGTPPGSVGYPALQAAPVSQVQDFLVRALAMHACSTVCCPSKGFRARAACVGDWAVAEAAPALGWCAKRGAGRPQPS